MIKRIAKYISYFGGGLISICLVWVLLMILYVFTGYFEKGIHDEPK